MGADVSYTGEMPGGRQNVADKEDVKDEQSEEPTEEQADAAPETDAKAQAYLKKLRDENADRRRANADLQKRLADQEAQLQELATLKQATLTEEQRRHAELEKAKADAATLKSELKQAKREAALERVHSRVVAYASRLKFRDPEDAWRLIDRALLVGEEMEKVVTEQLDALLADKPYLADIVEEKPAEDEGKKPFRVNPLNPEAGDKSKKDTSAERQKRLYEAPSVPFGKGYGGGVMGPFSG